MQIKTIMRSQSGMVVHTPVIPALSRLRPKLHREFKSSMKTQSRTTATTKITEKTYMKIAQ
jgi:hypothetical protein